MPTLPIELSSRPLGPTGVSTAAFVTASAQPSARMEIRDSTVEGAYATSVTSSSLARLFVNAFAAFTTTLFITLFAFALVPMMFGFQSAVVTSASMEPSLRRSDVVVLAPVGREAVEVGAIVNFRTAEGDVIHRVEALEPDGVRTKGDANDSADSVLVRRDDVTGVGVFLVPFVGLPPLWFDDRAWWKLVASAAGLVAAAHMARRAWLYPADAVGPASSWASET